MFEDKLKTKFQEIFRVKKVSFDQPDKLATEQGTIFIDIESAPLNVRNGKVSGRIRGSALIFGQSDKLTFGFLREKIAKADPDLIKDIFFSDFETNSKIYQNLVQRGFSFVYFFSMQHDPKVGSITSVTINITEA